MLFICFPLLVMLGIVLLGLGISTNNLYCSEGSVRVNCSCHAMSQIRNNIKITLSIKMNGLQTYKKESFLIHNDIVDVPFKLENRPHLTDSLKYTCLWTIPQNDSIICEKMVNIKLKDLPRRQDNVTLHIAYDKYRGYCLEVRSLNFSTSKTSYNIYGFYNSFCPNERSDIRWPSKPLRPSCDAGMCKLFDNDIYFRNCYTVKVDVVSDTGRCWTTPVSKLITFKELYGGLRNFTILETDQTSTSLTWNNPHGCCTVAIIPNLKFLFEICGAGKCENHTVPYERDDNKYKIESLKPYTKYKIRMSVEYKTTYDLDFAGWTSTEEATTLSQVPSLAPGKINCSFQSTERSIKFSWIPPVGKFKGETNKYLLKLEQRGHNDTKVKVNSSVCHSTSCSYTFKTIYTSETYRLSIRACSNGGCAGYAKVGFCSLKRRARETSGYSEDDSVFYQYIVHVLISVSELLFILLLAYLIRFIRRKRRQQQNKPVEITVVGPRLDCYHAGYSQPKPLLYNIVDDTLESEISTSSATSSTMLQSPSFVSSHS